MHESRATTRTERDYSWGLLLVPAGLPFSLLERYAFVLKFNLESGFNTLDCLGKAAYRVQRNDALREDSACNEARNDDLGEVGCLGGLKVKLSNRRVRILSLRKQ